MTNFHGILPSLSAISIDNRGVGVSIEGVGGMDNVGMMGRGGMGGVGGGKIHHLGNPMSSHNAYTMAYDTIVSHIVSGSKPRSPLPN